MKREKISSVILWSVISAAFIGPGTVTTAVTAGFHYQLDLLWAVVFATASCIVLQETSARIVIASGLSLGETVVKKFGNKNGFWINMFIGISIVIGCAAYEAGNILGGVSGLSLLFDGDGWVYTILISIVAAVVLWTGKQKWISTIMTLLVAMMAVAFFVLALNIDFSPFEVLMSAITPKIPAGSEMITLGLVGTTIVPYSLFLGSAISKGQTIPLMRLGLTVSVIIGGFITVWILLAGTLVHDFSSFSILADEFENNVGVVGAWALGIGLFAAGFSSAITSPYAASIVASTVMGAKNGNSIRWVWGVVLTTGFLFGVSGVKPIPIILGVQALNGLILPLVTAFLIIIVNDKIIMPKEHRPQYFYNLVLLLIFSAVLLIGLTSVDKSISTAAGWRGDHFTIIGILTAIIVLVLGRSVLTSFGKKEV
ncbi:MAG: divalent metal cation transporter [Bacteroidia bacterium]|nr:divalent metal cation transporter [Bacteroidia bacterium]